MIIQEEIVVNNIRLKHTYSSEKKYIKQIETDVIYDEAYDTLKRDYHYIETEQDIVDEPEPNHPQLI